MSSSDATIINDEEWLLGKDLCNYFYFPMAMKAALDLDVLQIISSVGCGLPISPTQIVAQIPNVTNQDAAINLDRILRVLASHSVLKCCVTLGNNGKPERLYGLTPLCNYLVKNKDGLSLAPLACLGTRKDSIEISCYLKDAVVEGIQPFFKAHGVNAFDYSARDPSFNTMFNKAMSDHSIMVMERILDVYQAFEDLEELVDVGGGVGSTLKLILSKYPHIKGVNFDLPHVLRDAPQYPGITHICGDMFESVPSSKTILMKWILHDWSDDNCIRILKNAHKALPKKGKVIAVDLILPFVVDNSTTCRQVFNGDLCMLAYCPAGKERTQEEFNDLAKAGGFAKGIKPICCVNGFWVTEFYK